MKALHIFAYSLLIVATMAKADQQAKAIGGVTVETSNRMALQIPNANERNASFNANLQKARLAGQISQCSLLIDVPVGTAHGNHSYGGLCTLIDSGKKSAVMICDDEMVGHFRVEQRTQPISTQELINFTVSNCYGG